jgi:hypothetical protein
VDWRTKTQTTLKRNPTRENKRLIFAVMRAQVYGEADLDDLVQEGWIGLWHAIKRYDPKRGGAFRLAPNYPQGATSQPVNGACKLPNFVAMFHWEAMRNLLPLLLPLQQQAWLSAPEPQIGLPSEMCISPNPTHPRRSRA